MQEFSYKIYIVVFFFALVVKSNAQEPTWQPYYIAQWGRSADYDEVWPVLNDSNTWVGNAAIAGEVINPPKWRSLQGGFGQDVSISAEEAIILKGQIEMVGGGMVENAYEPIRFALTYQDCSPKLNYVLTDSAVWSHKGNHFGYAFHPRTGYADISRGYDGASNLWSINNGDWNSTASNNGKPLGVFKQLPKRAAMKEGVYDLGISIISINDTINEIYWYLIKDDGSYWFGGISKVPSTTKKFNSILFGINEFEGTELRIIEMLIDKGEPLLIPGAHWDRFYIENWGIVGGRLSSWSISPGDFTGCVSLSGNEPASDWIAIRGDFGFNITPADYLDSALLIYGKIELEGGGFEDKSRLRLGLFNSSSAGYLDTSDFRWTGDENSSGYLIIPHSGDNELPYWEGNGTYGTLGKIVDTTWFATDSENSFMLSDEMQETSSAIGNAGKNVFQICVIPRYDKNEILYRVNSEDWSYRFEGSAIDENNPIERFNSFNIALNSSTATSMELLDVMVELIEAPYTSVSDDDNSQIPIAYELKQNYPNPFNPTTTINYRLPHNSRVQLKVYDMLGREVTTLVNKQQSAGSYRVNLNAENFATGMYIYTLQTDGFVKSKKMILLK